MRRVFAFIVVFILCCSAIFSSAESKTDALSLQFEKAVYAIMYQLYNDEGLDPNTTTIDKIELYTLPPNSSFSCTYWRNGTSHTSNDITDDKPFIAVYFTSTNRFGVTNSNVVVHYFTAGYDKVNEMFNKENYNPSSLESAFNFPGAIGGWATSLLISSVEQKFPWNISELDVTYLVNSYDPSIYKAK